MPSYATTPTKRKAARLRACLTCGTPCAGPRCQAHGGDRRTLTTTARGYGHEHQTRRAQLIPSAHGALCPICLEPMTAGQPLDLDHTLPLSINATSVGDRIAHAHWTARAHELRVAQAKILADILLDLDPDDPRTLDDARNSRLDPRSGAGDHQRLRMIPVHAPGVGGTIPGTDPLSKTISNDRWRTSR